MLLMLLVLPGMSKLAPGEEAAMQEVVTSAIPLGRMGEKADIALACVFLASPAAK
jgi:NAD(P)-dependent dehydrogenase (short-subunit alcohol dehydrogenase family)